MNARSPLAASHPEADVDNVDDDIRGGDGSLRTTPEAVDNGHVPCTMPYDVSCLSLAGRRGCQRYRVHGVLASEKAISMRLKLIYIDPDINTQFR